jgi:hypothetical protein
MKLMLKLLCLLVMSSSNAWSAQQSLAAAGSITGFTGCGNYMLVGRVGWKAKKLGLWYLEGSSAQTFIFLTGPKAELAKKFMGVNCELQGAFTQTPKPGNLSFVVNSAKPSKINSIDRALAHHIAKLSSTQCK